jgi:hypothetical protein
MNVRTAVREQLAEANLKLERFREVVSRLLAQGAIVRDEDRTEQLLYDDARRIEQLLEDYFELAGFRLYHDAANQFYRLYVAGAVVDGLPADELEPVPSLRARVSPDFVALALALRFLYQNRLNAGEIQTNGDALVSFEDIAATLQTQLKRQLPQTATDKLAVLNELKRQRLLTFSSTFSIGDEDALLVIRPTILGIVSNDALAAALEADGVIEHESKPQEQTDEA